MVIPSTAGLGNIIGQNISFLSAWSFADHDTGLPFASFDGIAGFTYSGNSQVTQYPLESGDFRYYNKMDTPNELELTLVKSGMSLPAQKKKFIKTLQDYVGKPKLVDIGTTSGAYIGYTIDGMNFSNLPDECADILLVTLSIKEIRIKAGIKVAKPKAMDRVKSAFQQLVGL